MGLLGVFGIMGTTIALVSIVTAMYVYPWDAFSWHLNSISSLGALGPPGKEVVFPDVLNVGLKVSGGLLVLFSVGLIVGRPSDTKNGYYRLGSIVFFIASLGVIGVGAFPLPDVVLHGFFAAVAFIGTTLALFIFGFGTTIYPTLSKLFGSISVIGIAVFELISVSGAEFGLALPELVIIVPAVIWVIPVSVMMIRGKLDP